MHISTIMDKNFLSQILSHTKTRPETFYYVFDMRAVKNTGLLSRPNYTSDTQILAIYTTHELSKPVLLLGNGIV